MPVNIKKLLPGHSQKIHEIAKNRQILHIDGWVIIPTMPLRCGGV